MSSRSAVTGRGKNVKWPLKALSWLVAVLCKDPYHTHRLGVTCAKGLQSPLCYVDNAGVSQKTVLS